MPVLIFGARAVDLAMQGEAVAGPLNLLAAMLLLFVSLGLYKLGSQLGKTTAHEDVWDTSNRLPSIALYASVVLGSAALSITPLVSLLAVGVTVLGVAAARWYPATWRRRPGGS